MLPRLVSLRRRPPRLPTHLRLISSHPTPPPASEGPDSVGALSSPSPSPLPSSSPGASPPVRVIVDPPPERYSGPPPSLPHRAPHYAHPVVPSPHKWNLPVAFGGQPQVEMGLQAGPHDDHPLPVVRVGTHTPNSLWQAMVVGNRDTFAKIRSVQHCHNGGPRAGGGGDEVDKTRAHQTAGPSSFVLLHALHGLPDPAGSLAASSVRQSSFTTSNTSAQSTGTSSCPRPCLNPLRCPRPRPRTTSSDNGVGSSTTKTGQADSSPVPA